MPPDGVLVIDKPAGPTSHDVVRRVRRLLDTPRAGHGGTLDPDATGVLLVAAGQATRFFPFLAGGRKAYEGLIRLGFATDTYDASGRPSGVECPDLPDRDALAGAMAAFVGDILQTPPRFSAKKLAGRPVHRMARAGEAFELAPSPVTVFRFDLKEYRPPMAAFEAECSPGTYIRSLAHDLGARLGCGGHLASLRRTASGPFDLSQAVTLEALELAAARGEAAGLLVPLERLLPGLPAVTVRPEAEARVRNGSLLEAAHLAAPPPAAGPAAPDGPDPAGVVRLFSASGRLLALARTAPDGAALHPFLVLT